MAFEQMKVLVDGLRQADVVGQQVDSADAAADKGASAVGQVVVDVLGREHGPGLVFPVPSGQTFFDSAFASGQLLVCSVFHSKRLLACKSWTSTQTASDAERQAFRVFVAKTSNDVDRSRWFRG